MKYYICTIGCFVLELNGSIYFITIYTKQEVLQKQSLVCNSALAKLISASDMCKNVYEVYSLSIHPHEGSSFAKKASRWGHC